jgi:hypothetical protein
MPSTKALLVGVTQYMNKVGPSGLEKSMDVDSAWEDVHRIKGLLKELKQAEPVPKPKYQVLTLTGDRFTTRDAVLYGLHWLFSGVTVGQQLLFYFSGHGVKRPQPGTNGTVLEEVLCASDTDWKGGGCITDEDIINVGYDALAGNACLEIVLECCYAGGVAASTATSTRFGCPFGASKFPAGSTVVWTACGAEENSHSGPEKPCGQDPKATRVGLFTHFFRQNFKSAARRRDLLDVVATKLYDYAEGSATCCPGVMKSQVPELICSKGAGTKDPADERPLTPAIGGCPVIAPSPSDPTTVLAGTFNPVAFNPFLAAAGAPISPKLTPFVVPTRFKKTGLTCDGVTPAKGVPKVTPP